MCKHSGNDKRPITQLPYADRQLISVTTDEVAKAAQAELKANGGKQSADYWARIAEAVTMVVLPAGDPIVEVTKEAIKTWGRARASGIKVLLVGKSEAAAITFPPGHPREGVLYIGHPAEASVYYTAAAFHRATFQHRVVEVVNLLMSLGATKIRVEHVAGWSKEFSARVSVPLGTPPDSLDAEAGGSASSHRKLLYEATLAGSSKPCIPDGLVWYPHEPTWQSVAKGRTQFGLRSFSLSLSYTDDFGVHAGLKTQVLKAGLDLGGSFEDHVSTVWRIEGEFGS